MKYLIAGLGNIGSEYAGTRHNIGFDIIQRLGSEREVSFDSSRFSFYGMFKNKGRQFHLIMPTTYMNLSGKAVRYWQEKLAIPEENILIVTDDLNLSFGSVRIRGKGSDGGHNGLKNIIELLGHNNFPRLRFGVGDTFSKGKQVDYVLGKWSEDELIDLDKHIDHCTKAIISFGMQGLAPTMTSFNKK